MKTFSIFLSIFVLMMLCSKKKEQSIKDLLSNNKNGKYWDLIYQTDINGIRQQTLQGKDSMPEMSLFFDDKRAVNYYIYDSNRVIDLNMISHDIVYTYNYQIRSDTLKVDGRNFLVENISTDSLVLIGVPNKNIVRKYRGVNASSRMILDSLPVVAKNRKY